VAAAGIKALIEHAARQRMRQLRRHGVQNRFHQIRARKTARITWPHGVR
jgi:hypothetical protein